MSDEGETRETADEATSCPGASPEGARSQDARAQGDDARAAQTSPQDATSPSGTASWSAVADSPERPQRDDATRAKEALADAGRKLADATRSATEAGSRSLGEGISAMREVSRAKRAHGDARARLEELEGQVREGEATLAHRREVERDYATIIQAQGEALKAASDELDETNERIAKTEDERDRRASDLEELKAANEERLAPDLATLTQAKGELDDASHAYSDAKRAAKTAQSQADSASNARDTQVASAQRAADAAAAKYERLQAQLAELRRDSSASMKKVTDASGDVAGALAKLEQARDEVARTKADTKLAHENAQTHLYTKREALRQAEADLETARVAHDRQAEAYGKLRDEADAQEREVSDEVARLEESLRSLKSKASEAHDRMAAAQALIDEAEDIHAHPRATEALAEQVEDNRSAAEVQRRQVAALAEEERAVRDRTRDQRIVFFVIIACAAAVVLLLIRLFTR